MPPRKAAPGNRLLAAVAVLLLAGLAVWQKQDTEPAALTREASGEWMHLQGKVDRILEDDDNGSRHQRFIVRMDDGHTVLVAHNIDVAPRLQDLRVGEALMLRGEYQWNERGGVLHWTHHDPHGGRRGGYIERMGKRYE